MQGSVKSKFKTFFRETFRPHTKEEYAEIFSRDFRDGEVKKRKYPWLYARAFALFFVVFAVTVLAYRLSGYSIGYITAIVFGAVLFNIPVLILCFEIYPHRDISLITLLLLVLIGGGVTCAVILLGYEYIYAGGGNPWVSYLWTGFWEELIKAVFAVSAILLLKKKNPLCCFLIGFAVGTGYSFFEDLGYIYMYSRGGGYGVTSYGWIVLMSVARGLSCVVSHAPWTAVICWAFAQFEKPFLNFRFYGVVVLSMLLHYLADVPFYADEVAFLKSFNWGWVIEAFVVVAIILECYLMLRQSFKGVKSGICTDEYPLARKLKLSGAGNVSAVLCALLLGLCSLVGCSLSIGYVNKTISFSEKTPFYEWRFVRYMQNDLNLSVDWQREYDAEKENYSEFVENGELKCATQEYTDGGCVYYYVYGFENGEYSLQNVGTKILGKIYYCRRIFIYENYAVIDYGYPANYSPVGDEEIIIDGETGETTDDDTGDAVEIPQPLKIVSFFAVNEEARTARYDVETKSFIVTLAEKQFKGLGVTIALSVASGVALIGGISSFCILKYKSKKIIEKEEENEQLHFL